MAKSNKFQLGLPEIVTFTVVLLVISVSHIDFFSGTFSKYRSYDLMALYIGGGSLLIYLMTGFGKPLRFDSIDLATSIFMAYILFANILSNNTSNWGLTLILILAYYSFFFWIRNSIGSINKQLVFKLLLFGFIVQSIIGAMQYFGVIDNPKPYYPMIGTFSNPMPFGIYMCMGTIVSFGLFMGSRKEYTLSSSLYLALSVWFLFNLVISNSRVSLLAIIVWAVIWIVRKNHARLRVNRLIIIGAVALLLSVSLFGLYHLKKDSADGRVFIWKRSIELIMDSPVLGVGMGNFQPTYMDSQADYFSTHSHNSKEAFLADNISHPFSEWILITAENGLIGLVLVLVLVYVIVKSLLTRMSAHFIEGGILMALLVASFFSYPFKETPLLLVVLLCMGSISVGRPIYVLIPKSPFVISLAVLVLCATLVGTGTVYQWAYGNWAAARKESFFGDQDLAREHFYKASEFLSKDGHFLFNYGSTLALIGDKDEMPRAISTLELGLKYYDDYQARLNLGDVYISMGESDLAIQNYKRANNMAPNRFQPLYSEFLAYKEKQDKEKATALAMEILSKRAKIPSRQIEEMRDAAANYLNKQE